MDDLCDAFASFNVSDQEQNFAKDILERAILPVEYFLRCNPQICRKDVYKYPLHPSIASHTGVQKISDNSWVGDEYKITIQPNMITYRKLDGNMLEPHMSETISQTFRYTNVGNAVNIYPLSYEIKL